MIIQFINISHLHPLLVHLPIGILVLLFFMEVILRKKRTEESQGILLTIILLAFISSVFSLFTGWRLGGEGGYEGHLLRLHKWTAVGLTIAVGALYLLKKTGKPKLKKVYWPFLIGVLGLLTVTGHFGASMTHGENFLFEHKESVSVSISDIHQALVYQDVVRPIFENHCTSCHNSGKSNGGLIMSTKASLLAGGNSGDFFSVSGESGALQRIHLPLEDKKHMPPNGKLQLTEEQVFYLEWWLEHEHCFDCKVSDLEPNERELELLRLLEIDNSSVAKLERSVSAFPSSWINELMENSISVQPLNAGSSLVTINLNQSDAVTENQMKLITTHAENVVELNLGNTNFSDDWAHYLGACTNLIKLQLQHTSVSDQSVSALTELALLESVNFYGTDITIEALSEFKQLPALKTVYVWQTDISSAELKAFMATSPPFEVTGQFESELLAESKLESPIISFGKTLFTDTVHVKLSSDFNGTQLFYSLDGTRPDTSSMEFTETLVIDKSTILSAISYKKDWGMSQPSSATFKQVTVPLKSAQVSGKWHEKYGSSGASTLINGTLGTRDFSDGNWLGFQGISPSFVLELAKAQEISNVSVSVMSAQPSWIFYPKGFTVYVSNEKSNWEKVHYSSYASVQQQPETQKKFFDLRFESVQAKYIKVVLESPLENPEWHASAGEPCYVFIDEILVE